MRRFGHCPGDSPERQITQEYPDRLDSDAVVDHDEPRNHAVDRSDPTPITQADRLKISDNDARHSDLGPARLVTPWPYPAGDGTSVYLSASLPLVRSRDGASSSALTVRAARNPGDPHLGRDLRPPGMP